MLTNDDYSRRVLIDDYYIHTTSPYRKFQLMIRYYEWNLSNPIQCLRIDLQGVSFILKPWIFVPNALRVFPTNCHCKRR